MPGWGFAQKWTTSTHQSYYKTLEFEGKCFWRIEICPNWPCRSSLGRFEPPKLIYWELNHFLPIATSCHFALFSIIWHSLNLWKMKQIKFFKIISMDNIIEITIHKDYQGGSCTDLYPDGSGSPGPPPPLPPGRNRVSGPQVWKKISLCPTT